MVKVQVGPPTETVMSLQTRCCGFFIAYLATYWQQTTSFFTNHVM